VTVILMSIMVFVGMFYLSSHLYPAFEKQVLFWQKRRLDKMAPKLDRMFLDVSAKNLILLDVLSPLVCFILGYIIAKNVRIAIGLGVIGLLVPHFVLRVIEKRRVNKFTAQLPDALMILCASLKVGMSLQQAFEVLVEEMPKPMNQEFSMVLRQMRMGFSMENALGDLRKRMRVDDLELAVSALLIARETGGDITDTLAKVVNTIKERNKLNGKLKAITAQAKLQAVIMSLLPFAFAAVVYQADHKYFDVFFHDPLGRLMLGGSAVLLCIGIFFVFRLSKVDI